MSTMYVVLAIVVLVFFVLMKTAIVVPQQSAFVVETLGRYSRTIQAGFHILVPFVERIAYKHNLKEEALDIPEQVCITKDNVQVGVDGVLYMATAMQIATSPTTTTQLIGDASTDRSTDIPSARRVFGRSNNNPSTRNGSTRGASAQPSKPDSMSAKQEETRQRRLAQLITCSAQNKPIAPLARKNSK